MILQLLIQIVISAITIMFSWLPSVETLPFGIDTILQFAVDLFKGAINTIPYLEVVWICFLYAISFEILLLILKFFLGHRSPGSNYH